MEAVWNRRESICLRYNHFMLLWKYGAAFLCDSGNLHIFQQFGKIQAQTSYVYGACHCTAPSYGCAGMGLPGISGNRGILYGENQ